jgi:methionyl-tRNA formyltransferase
MRIVFMGTPDFAKVSLAALLDKREQVVGVFTQPDRPRGRGKKIAYSPVKVLALEHQLPVFQPPTLKNELAYTQLQDLSPDLIVVVAYGQILPVQVLNLPPLGCINVHASLLPKYRGAAPIHWAIINGETITGITTMFMTTQLDAGDMILQKPLTIDPAMTVGEAHDRLAVLGGELLVETVSLIKKGNCPRIPQDDQEATYAPMLCDFHEVIDWNANAVAIVNKIRGMNPWSGAYTMRNGERLKIYVAHVVEGFMEQGIPGQVLAIDQEGFIVQAGKGFVKVTQVHPAGKKQMAAVEFLKGSQLGIGAILGTGH